MLKNHFDFNYRILILKIIKRNVKIDYQKSYFFNIYVNHIFVNNAFDILIIDVIK